MATNANSMSTLKEATSRLRFSKTPSVSSISHHWPRSSRRSITTDDGTHGDSRIRIEESSPFVLSHQWSSYSMRDGEDDMDDDLVLENDDRLIMGATPLLNEEVEEGQENNEVLYQVQALGTFKAQEKGDLSIQAGEILQILQSSREDDWLLAENALGEKGLVPSNHVKKIENVSEAVIEVFKDERTTLKLNGSSSTTTQGGKHLWDKLKSNLNQPNLADVLSAFGALPSGFRESTLNTLLTQSDKHLMSSSVFPHLALTGMSFKDIKWDYNKDQLKATESPVCREFVILAAKMIPTPGKGMEVLSRHVRIALFNKAEILSNIHTVRAKWSQQEEKTWRFLPKSQTALNSLYHRYCVVRTNITGNSIELLFELCITFKKKSGEVKEISSGWSSIPLYDHNGSQLQNRTYELKVHGGTPFDSGIDLDAAQSIRARGGRIPSILRRNMTPRLYVQFIQSSKEARSHNDLLPSNIVTSQQFVKSIGCFRQLVGEAFLSCRKGLPLPAMVHRPALGVFITAVDQSDIMDYTLEKWTGYLQSVKRSERNNFKAASSLLEKTLLYHTYPVLYSVKLPPSIWGDIAREKERGAVLEKFSKFQANNALLSTDLFPVPFNSAEQTFKVYT